LELKIPDSLMYNMKKTGEKIFGGFGCRLYWLILFFVITVAGVGVAAETKQAERSFVKRVLVLDSYDQTDFWAKEMLQGIESAFGGYKDKVDLDVEYMDTRHFHETIDEKHLEHLYNLYKYKHISEQYDAIIAGDDNAFIFLLKYRKDLYPNIPVVFCGINIYRDTIDDLLKGQSGITGIIEVNRYVTTIETALGLHPQVSQIVVVCDKKFDYFVRENKIEESIKALEQRVQFVDFLLGDITSGELSEEVKNLGAESIVFLPTGRVDANVPMYSMEGGFLPLEKYCKAPIYTIWKGWIDRGLAVGGDVTSSYHHGREAAKMAMRILDGEKPEDIAIMREGPSVFMFDHRQMMQFGIPPSKLPEGAIILNRPESFYRKYRTQIYIISLIVAGLSAATILLSVNIVRRIKAEQGLQKARDELEIRVEQRTSELRDTNEQLLASQKQLRSLASELSLAEERLRHRIAIDVHDNISQSLVLSKIKMHSLAKSLASSKFSVTLKEILELTNQTIDRTRTLSLELSPPVLYELGFEAAIRWLVRRISEQNNLLGKFNDDGLNKPLHHNVRVLMFQCIRELLVNVVKHANAQSIKVSSKRIDKQVQVIVEDDGVGFDVPEGSSMDYESGGFGLFSIKERLGHIGGTFEMDSVPGKGTRITITAPIRSKSHSGAKGSG